MLIKIISFFGQYSTNLFHNIVQAIYMLLNIFFRKCILFKKWSLLIKQIYNMAVLSLMIIVLSGLFIGMVLGLQGYIMLTVYGAESNLGVMISLSLLRELGPVVTALLFAGHIGSALTAEIGLMKATEQLASLEMMAIDPLSQIIAPRFWAGIISIPLLTIIFVAVGICGSAIIGIYVKDIDHGFFWSATQEEINYIDILNCLIKSLFFSVVVTWIALFNGYNAIPTSEGIGRATTNTVVNSSLAILAIDFLLTLFMFGS